MPRDSLQKHTLNLREGDWDYITARFASKGHHTSTIVRTVVSRFVDAMKDQEEKGNIQVKVDL